jgi:hypothetical protein
MANNKPILLFDVVLKHTPKYTLFYAIQFDTCQKNMLNKKHMVQ